MKNLRPEVYDDVAKSGDNGDIFEVIYYTAFNLTRKEVNYIMEQADDEECNKFAAILDLKTTPTFCQIKEVLAIRNKYLKDYNGEVQEL